MNGLYGNGLNPKNRPVPVFLQDLVSMNKGIIRYQYGDYNFYQFRTYGQVESIEKGKNVIPVFKISCLFDTNASIGCFMPTPGGPTLCEKINEGDIVTVTGKLQETKDGGIQRLNLVQVHVEKKTKDSLAKFKEFILLEVDFCKAYHNYISTFSETSDNAHTALLRKIKYDGIKSPQNQSKITVSTDSGISSGLSTPQTKSINTSINSNFKETVSKTKVNDYIRPPKRAQPVILKESSPYFEEPREKKSKSDKLCDFIVWVIGSTKENDKENWQGMSIDDIITSSLSTRELVCEAIKDLALNSRIRMMKPNIYDVFD
uniref:OB domain-containing protein n=1 Tax=Strongyloides papillosus TaxID=174720 RepID=A0A0N5CBE1_STREA